MTRTKRLPLLLTLLATLLLALGGCGQKGPLYHPEPAPQDTSSEG
jgi:predicted small lipoprotein YifL